MMKKKFFCLSLIVSLFTGMGSNASSPASENSSGCNNLENIEACAQLVNGIFPIAVESEWKYNDAGTDLGTAWKETSFDDTAWELGNGVFGYGEGVENTILDFGPDTNNKYPTYYFRNTFDIVDASQYGDLVFNVKRDDGVVVYVNGTEAFRMNMPGGPITYNTFASSTMGGADETTFYEMETSNLLQNGVNVIAVELHQATANSSDLGFDMSVSPQLPPLEPTPYPVAKDTRWKYLDSGINLGNVAWNDISYNNSGWEDGFGPLGYGDPANTVISYGPDSGNKYITYFFSKDIEVDLASVADFVEFGLKRDDGAIVYVNGEEVFRQNMPAGPVNYLTFSSTIADGIDENIYFTEQLPKTIFVDGLNRIAVEVHNRDGQSSDIKFDMYIKDALVAAVLCDQPHIGCFTSIVPAGQSDNLILPQSHNFQLILKQGDPYTVGSGLIPGNHDYTAYVPVDGSSEIGRLAVNHETTPGGVTISNLHLDTYTNLWMIDTSQPVDLYNSALVTTSRNCSGGTTSWGTVITAEESTSGGDLNGDGYQDVGWFVEIDPATSQVMDYGNGQEKLWAMGRMSHENIVVTEDGSTAYYGEDGGTDCVYKFVADTPGDLTAGTVYVLKMDLPLSNNDPSSTTAQWIEVPNDTQEERNNIRILAGALGGTDFNGVEDCEINPIDGMIYFTSKGKDRIYRFTDNGTTVSDFETVIGGMSYQIETTQGNYTEPWSDGNDNLVFDDKGNLWVCQDGGNNYIWVVRPNHNQSDHDVALFGAMPAGSEPTGLTFTPDHKYGFFSVQHPSGNNAPQVDATLNEVIFDKSASVVFSLREHIGIQQPLADFVADNVIVTEGETVVFTDLSTNNPDNWLWNFEGGEPATSTEQAPSITYNTAGEYDVSLIASNVAGSNEAVKTEYIIVEELLGIDPENLLENITVYPNPTSGQVTVELNAPIAGEEIRIEAYDLLGRTLLETSNLQSTGGNQKISLDLSSLMQGTQVVIIKVYVGDKTAHFKILNNN